MRPSAQDDMRMRDTTAHAVYPHPAGRLSDLLGAVVRAIPIPAKSPTTFQAPRLSDDQIERHAVKLSDGYSATNARSRRNWTADTRTTPTNGFRRVVVAEIEAWEDARRAGGKTSRVAVETLVLSRQDGDYRTRERAGILYKTQDPAEHRRLLETVLSNCTLDRGTLCPTYSSPFNLLARGNETVDWRARLDSNQRPPA